MSDPTLDEYRVGGTVAIDGVPKIWSTTRVRTSSPEQALALACRQIAEQHADTRRKADRATWAEVRECTNLSELARGYAFRGFDPCI